MNLWVKFLSAYGILVLLSNLVVTWLYDDSELSVQHPPIVEFKSAGSDADPVPLIIFHSIGGRQSSLEGLATQFSRDQKTVLFPNLYAFGREENALSLSERASLFANEWFPQDSRPVHLVGYTLGGAAAVEVALSHPERVASLTLISASLTQPFEMLGDYSLNRALYSLQAGAYWFVDHLVPHFGILRLLPIEYIQLKTWAETDLRGMEEKLQGLQMPVLVLHGNNDYLIPPEAAIHHHALIPNSQLVLTEADHGINLRRSEFLFKRISEFVSKVEGQSFVPEPSESGQRPPDTISGKRFWWIAAIIFVGTKFSEDLATVSAGLLVSQGVFPMWAAMLVCFVGIIVGDTALYLFGRIAGIDILRKRPFSWVLKEQTLIDAEEWFQTRGLMVVVISRFVPATRLPVYVATGVMGVPALKFIGVLSLAALIWTPLIIVLTTLLGKPLLAFIESYEQWALPILLGFFVLLTILIKFIVPLATRRGRRLMYRQWVRVRNFGRKLGGKNGKTSAVDF